MYLEQKCADTDNWNYRSAKKKKEKKEKQDFRTTEPTHLGRAAQVRIQQMLHGEITSYCLMGEHYGVRKWFHIYGPMFSNHMNLVI